MGYRRSDINSAIDAARKAAMKAGKSVYVFPTYSGYRLDFDKKKVVIDRHIEVTPDGKVWEIDRDYSTSPSTTTRKELKPKQATESRRPMVALIDEARRLMKRRRSCGCS
jgi:DNA invertase Pin-like site-specific DNA recombinase